MADDKTTKQSEPAKRSDTVMVNLHNPTKAARVIHDGIVITEGVPAGAIPMQKQIAIAPGETKKNVTLHRTIAEELRARNRAKKDSDLVEVDDDFGEEDKPAA